MDDLPPKKIVQLSSNPTTRAYEPVGRWSIQVDVRGCVEKSHGVSTKIVAVVLNAASEDENLTDRIEDMTKKIMEIHLPKKSD